MDLDETDFNENEARFEEEKRRLEAKKYDLDTRHLRGATPLEQLGLLGAVGQQDLMVILASRNRHPLEVLNVANGNVTMRDSDEQGAGSSEMPTPKLEEKAQHGRGQGGSLDDQQLQPRSPTPEYDSPPSQSPPPIRTPELQSLPFLNREPLTPLSELDTFSWNVAKYESQKEPAKLQVLRELGAQSQFEDEMGNEYALFYRSWKLHIKELDERAAIEHIDRQRSAEKSVAPEGPEIAPPLPTPTEGTRRSRIYQTEYDLKKIEDESRRTHEEEEAARRKDALEALGPDRTREAEIPEMISDSEARLRMFKDTSCLRDPDNAVVFYQLRPPVDNFTLEEHRIMVENFRDYPKKWGKLTQGLVDRDYKDCINHYYATKWNKEFKLRTVKGSRKKNVRGGRAGGRGRTNALISNLGGAEPDLYGGDETNAPVASVTERGRPRRAAAPSFGDNKNDDTAQTPGKKGSRPVLSTEATAEKVARKQKTGARGVAQRRPRGQPSALKRSASPQKVDPTPETRAPHAADIRGGYPDMSAREDYFSRAMQNPPHTETNRSLLPHQRAGDMTTVQDLYSAPSTMPGSFDPLKGLGQATPKVPPSSYWAVREADNFPDYLKRYGTDWNAISTHMGGGKSATMCKNYFHRLVSQGRTDLEEVAAATDASRNQSGEAGASYAETTVPPRRARGELQTPSLHPRTIAPSVGSDNVVQVEEATAHPHSQPATEPTSRYPTWNGSPQAGGNMLSERRHTRNISSGHRAEPGPVDWVQGTNIGSQHASSRAWATQGQPATLDDTYRQRPLSQAGPSYGDSVVEDRIRLSEDERRRFSAEHRSRYLQGPTRDNPEYYGRSMYPPGPSLHETSQRQLHEQSQYIAPPERSTWQDKRETSTRDAFQGLPADRGASVNQPLSQFHRDSGPAPYRSTASAFSPNQTPTFAPARIQADSRYEPAARMPEPPVRSSQQSTSYGLESTHVRSSSTTGHFDPLRRHAPRVEEESRLQQASPTSGAVPPQPVRTEPPQRKSNIFSVLNDSDDPKPSRSAPTLSARTGTPPQFAPLTAPPRPPSVVERRDLYGELPRPASTSYQPSPLGQPTYGSPPISGREPIRQHEQRPEWMQPQIAQSGSSSTYDRGPLSSSYLHRSSAGSLPSLQAHRSNPSPPPQQFGFGSSSGVRTPKPGHSRDSSFSRPQQSSYPSAAAQYTAPERGSQYGERIQYGAPHSTSQTPQPSYASAYAPPATSSAPQHYGTPSNQQAGSYGAGSGYPPQAPPAQHSEYAAPPRFGDRATFEQQERDRQREAEAVRPQGFGQSRYGENRYGEPRQ
ncbi:hypothetical protein FH972_022390 [Carpinus fangiana]|uniref:Myb-like domain-containing protein n=1 Tax=Carpinus fangiana TaxID=176857 RepID=A0A5N6KSF8_9ROSI|nr:hypothetical protein FH972_022390 [Carpinus fangiana]